MAYGVTVASVSKDALDRYRGGSDDPIPASRTVVVSHFVIAPDHVHPAEQLRFRAVDGGVLVREGLRHPLRVPLCHGSPEVAEIAHDLAALLASNIDLDEWTLSELIRLREVFAQAAAAAEAVVTFLEPPDDARASVTDLIPLTTE